MKFNLIQGQNGSMTWLVPIIGLFLFILFLNYSRRQHEEKQAILAYYKTKNALQLLTINLDKGKSEIAHLSLFEDSVRKIYNH
nr:hypothetical protein [uncultured Allomuricauda sp.]